MRYVFDAKGKAACNFLYACQLHFAKPSAYNEIYNMKNRWAKDSKLYHLFADEESSFSISDCNEAKARRDITASIFSRHNTLKMQDTIQGYVRIWCMSYCEVF